MIFVTSSNDVLYVNKNSIVSIKDEDTKEVNLYHLVSCHQQKLDINVFADVLIDLYITRHKKYLLYCALATLSWQRNLYENHFLLLMVHSKCFLVPML